MGYAAGRTALTAAIDNRNFGIATLLLEHGAPPNTLPNRDRSPGFRSIGFLAVKNGVPADLFTQLLERGLRPATRISRSEALLVEGEFGFVLAHNSRLLHLAIKLRHYEQVMLLISLGGDALSRSKRCSVRPITEAPLQLRSALGKLRPKHGGITGVAGETCSICLDEVCVDQQVVVLRCRHAFHLGCAARLVQHDGLKCPLCRKALVAKSVGVAATSLQGRKLRSSKGRSRVCVPCRGHRKRSVPQERNNYDDGGLASSNLNVPPAQSGQGSSGSVARV